MKTKKILNELVEQVEELKQEFDQYKERYKACATCGKMADVGMMKEKKEPDLQYRKLRRRVFTGMFGFTLYDYSDKPKAGFELFKSEIITNYYCKSCASRKKTK